MVNSRPPQRRPPSIPVPLTLLAPTVYGELRYALTGGDRWKLWKSGQPLAATARELSR